jgi:hypothetical protein
MHTPNALTSSSPTAFGEEAKGGEEEKAKKSVRMQGAARRCRGK